MNERLDRFTKLLYEIFELDKSDLDFGIYRVLNLRKEQIEQFLTDRLPQMVQDTLTPFAKDSKNEIRSQIKQIEDSIAEMGITLDDLPDTAQKKQQYLQLQKQFVEGADLSALETDVYSALYSFFNRYYEDGDFISKRRYKEGVYAIPYEGEEVKLYWANQDQYYIKTSENFKDYTFVFDDITVHFRLMDATAEKNNNKEIKEEKRTFMLFKEDEEKYPGIKTFEYNQDAAEIVIRFVYDIQTKYTGKSNVIEKKWHEENCEKITTWLLSQHRAEFNPIIAPIPTGKGKDTTTMLEKHLKNYVAKNTFDFYIHKDLRGFLTRELDFFIKSEIMHLDDLDTNSEVRVGAYLAKVKAIKRVGKIIIDFLAQIEDFQKKLWLKKKFIVETNWCITLDKINETFWPEIVSNQNQIDEWITMYAINEAEGWTNPPTIDFLRVNQNLIIDTKHFSDKFKYTLLENIPNLDEQTDGLMINGDNFHGLELLRKKYENGVDCIYIDPPYNAKSSEILYKNSFKHSAWLTLMDNRIDLSRHFLTDKSVYVCAIDEVEQERLGMLLGDIFSSGSIEKTCVTVVHNPSGQQGDNFSATHEYAYFLYPVPGRSIAEQYREDPNEWDKRGLRDVTGDDSLRTAGKTCFYPIYVKDGAVIGFGDVCADDFHPPVNIIREDGIIEVYPIDPEGIERKWRFGRDNIEEIHSQLSANYISNRDVWDIQRLKKTFNYKTVWQAPKYSANNYGTQVLNSMFPAPPFSYPKSIYTVKDCIEAALNGKETGLVMDFFAGSGTTGQAILTLNQAERRIKYILVEMGNYFSSATLPRVKKSVYLYDEKDWKDGKPCNRNKGTSQIIKYMSLESYEDTLSNIKLSNNGGQLKALLGEDYLIHYMVDFESRGSLLDVEAFTNPFAYTMKITEKNECQERRVDLVETFNYLIGLTVVHQSEITYWRSEPAVHPNYEGAVDLVNDINGQYAFQQFEGTLPDGRRSLVIWRTVTDDLIESNSVLDSYFSTYRKNAEDRRFDIIFVNGDSNLENLRGSNENWSVSMTEIEFRKRMFEEE